MADISNTEQDWTDEQKEFMEMALQQVLAQRST
jgi:hypothetical protein